MTISNIYLIFWGPFEFGGPVRSHGLHVPRYGPDHARFTLPLTNFACYITGWLLTGPYEPCDRSKLPPPRMASAMMDSPVQYSTSSQFRGTSHGLWNRRLYLLVSMPFLTMDKIQCGRYFNQLLYSVHFNLKLFRYSSSRFNRSYMI